MNKKEDLIRDFFDFNHLTPIFGHAISIKFKYSELIYHIEETFFDSYINELNQCYDEYERNYVKMKFSYILRDRINEYIRKNKL